MSQRLVTRADNAAVKQYMDMIRLDIVEQALVVRDQYYGAIGMAQVINSFRDCF